MDILLWYEVEDTSLFQECLRPDDLHDAGRVFVLLDTVGRLGNAMSTLAILLALQVKCGKYILSKFRVYCYSAVLHHIMM